MRTYCLLINTFAVFSLSLVKLIIPGAAPGFRARTTNLKKNGGGGGSDVVVTTNRGWNVAYMLFIVQTFPPYC